MVIANIVNFVNNNITGGGKLFVTVVNVFGKWIGDFVGPGQKKETLPAASETASQSGIGGVSQSGSSSSGSSDSGGTGSQSGNTSVVTSTKPILRSTIGSYVLGARSVNDIATSDSSPSVNSVAGNKAVKINLAWLVMAIPLALPLFIIVRRKISALQHERQINVS